MRRVAAVALISALLIPGAALHAADPPTTPARLLELRFTPTSRAQIALWIEKGDGTFLTTLRLTQAVALRGIGNRPGASQMNSGFRWPYGRRENVLPIWAHRRAAAPGAQPFNRVIFQQRTAPGGFAGEGAASQTSQDSTPESYFCLSFQKETTRRAALDAVTCASAFRSDKGRFIKPEDVAAGYPEPVVVDGQSYMRPMELSSVYPPRRDVPGCSPGPSCYDHEDLRTFADHVRTVMPEIDAVTMATPPQGQEQTILFTVPEDWPSGDYAVLAEVNVEGDYNDAFNDASYPTPRGPSGAWDIWALDYGYPYRGQPSVVYRVPIKLGSSGTYAVKAPAGYGSVHGFGAGAGELRPMDGLITDNAAGFPGSGADRLHLAGAPPDDYRLQVQSRDQQFCAGGTTPAIPTSVTAAPVADQKNSHQWGDLRFLVPFSDRPIAHYDVRYSSRPILPGDAETFMQALPAVAANIDTVALMVPVTGARGAPVEVSFGGMEPLQRYWVAIRAVDACNVAGPYAVAELETTRINFTQLSGCFVATAAYGSALEPRVEALRTVRDALRPRSAVAAAATDLYYRSGPAAAALIGRSETARAVVRSWLGPVTAAAAAAAPFLR